MNLDEFYAVTGGSLEEVRGRLAKDERIYKYLRKFPASTDFDDMIRGIEAEDYDIAFRASHNLKGVAANLGLADLFNVSSALCEEYRNGKPAKDVTEMIEKVRVKYEETINAIEQLQ